MTNNRGMDTRKKKKNRAGQHKLENIFNSVGIMTITKQIAIVLQHKRLAQNGYSNLNKPNC